MNKWVLSGLFLPSREHLELEVSIQFCWHSFLSAILIHICNTFCLEDEKELQSVPNNRKRSDLPTSGKENLFFVTVDVHHLNSNYSNFCLHPISLFLLLTTLLITLPFSPSFISYSFTTSVFSSSLQWLVNTFPTVSVWSNSVRVLHPWMYLFVYKHTDCLIFKAEVDINLALTRTLRRFRFLCPSFDL